MVESILEDTAVVFHFVRFVTSHIPGGLPECLPKHQFRYSGLCTDYLSNLLILSLNLSLYILWCVSPWPNESSPALSVQPTEIPKSFCHRWLKKPKVKVALMEIFDGPSYRSLKNMVQNAFGTACKWVHCGSPDGLNHLNLAKQEKISHDALERRKSSSMEDALGGRGNVY